MDTSAGTAEKPSLNAPKSVFGFFRRGSEPTDATRVSPRVVEAETEASMPPETKEAPQPVNPPLAAQQVQNLSTRLGGWLTSTATSAGERLGVAAARGATAIQRLTGAEKYQDYHEALVRLERSAAELRGEARTAALRRWVAVLKELGTSLGGSGSGESDWQQLHLAPFEGIADGVGEAGLAIKANEVLFVDSEHEDEVLTFREVFLGSRALELLLAGFIAEPPTSDEEHALLASLLGASLGGDAALHQALAELFCRVAAQRATARHPVTVAAQDLGALVAGALGALKLQAGVELLDRKMATLRADINEKAAEAAKVYKFNAGAAHPTADSSPETVAAGLAATAEVMQLNATLTHLAAQRGALVAAAAAPQFSSLVDQLQEHSAEVGDSIAEVVRRLEITRTQKAEGDSYRVQKLEEMEAGLREVVGRIHGMEQRKAALLQELEALDQQLFKLKSQWADLEEGKNVFEEGNSFTMEALQQQLDQMSALQEYQVAEEAAVEAAAELLGAAAGGWAAGRPAELASARAVEADTGREYMHAATRHCYYQRAELQLLLRQLRFCAAELQAIANKQGDMVNIGVKYFSSIMVDMKKGQSRLAVKYLHCESAMLRRLTDLTILRATFAPCRRPGEPESDEDYYDEEEDAAGVLLGAQLRPIPMSDELEDVFQSMDALRVEFEGLPRPEGLPPPGEGLPTASAATSQEGEEEEGGEEGEGEFGDEVPSQAMELAARAARAPGAPGPGPASSPAYSERSTPASSPRDGADEAAVDGGLTGKMVESDAAREALEASTAAERQRISDHLAAPASPDNPDAAPAALAPHSDAAASARSSGVSPVGILAAAVSDSPRAVARRTAIAQRQAAPSPSQQPPASQVPPVQRAVPGAAQPPGTHSAHAVGSPGPLPGSAAGARLTTQRSQSPRSMDAAFESDLRGLTQEQAERTESPKTSPPQTVFDRIRRFEHK